MSIVVGIDFSEHSRDAARVAAVLARRLGDRLQLLHVVDPWLSQAFTKDASNVVGPAEKQLQSMGEALAQTAGVEVEAVVRVGLPDEEIAARAVESGATLIVTSALGWRSDARWRLGGIAERLSRHTPLPYLMVRAPQPLLDWGEGRRPLRISIGDDFSRACDSALESVTMLQKVGPCEVTVAHVYDPSVEHRRLGLSFAREKEVEAVLEKELQERVSSLLPGGARVRIEPGHGPIAESLLQIAQEQNADLILLGAQAPGGALHLWSSSVAHAIVNEAPMAVAFVPAAAVPAVVQLVPPVRRVLVPTDLTALANQAIAHGYALAPQGGEVVLLTVVDREQLQSEARRRLEALVPAAAAERGIRTSFEVVGAVDIPRAIAQAAERVGADVICMASRGRTGARRLVLGSVAQEVMSRSSRPVTLIRGRA